MMDNNLKNINFEELSNNELLNFIFQFSKILSIRDNEKIKIDELNISIRLYQSLKQIDIKYLNQLSHIKKDDFLRLKNFSSFSIKELFEIMNEKNITFLS
jgi:DNA-directed RNA polymerase alpha subunit